MMKYLLFLLLTNCALAQTVSTFFSEEGIEIDDAMAFDADGNLYGSNFSGSSVYKIIPDGTQTIFASGFMNPNGLAFDADGNLFINEYSASMIHKYAPNGSVIESYATNGLPSGLIATPNGDMIFTNVSDNSINLLSAEGNITQLYQGTPLNSPVGLAYDANNTLFIGNFVGREIYRLVGNTVEYVATVPDGGATTDPFLGFITYAGDKLYGTNFGGHKIYEIDPTQIDAVTTFAGGPQGDIDGDISFATFDNPNGIIYNATEMALYISEFSGDGHIRKIDDFILSIDNYTTRKEVVVVPNPAQDNINLVSNSVFSTSQGNVSIFSLSGKLIKLYNSVDLSEEIKIDQLQSGLYFVEIEFSNGQLFKSKFVKK